jgi:hypothetical protein
MSHIHVNELIENNETEVAQNQTTVTEGSDFRNGVFPNISGIQKRKILSQKTRVLDLFSISN